MSVLLRIPFLSLLLSYDLTHSLTHNRTDPFSFLDLTDAESKLYRF